MASDVDVRLGPESPRSDAIAGPTVDALILLWEQNSVGAQKTGEGDTQAGGAGTSLSAAVKLKHYP